MARETLADALMASQHEEAWATGQQFLHELTEEQALEHAGNLMQLDQLGHYRDTGAYERWLQAYDEPKDLSTTRTAAEAALQARREYDSASQNLRKARWEAYGGRTEVVRAAEIAAAEQEVAAALEKAEATHRKTPYMMAAALLDSAGIGEPSVKRNGEFNIAMHGSKSPVTVMGPRQVETALFVQGAQAKMKAEALAAEHQAPPASTDA